MVSFVLKLIKIKNLILWTFTTSLREPCRTLMNRNDFFLQQKYNPSTFINIKIHKHSKTLKITLLIKIPHNYAKSKLCIVILIKVIEMSLPANLYIFLKKIPMVFHYFLNFFPLIMTLLLL